MPPPPQQCPRGPKNALHTAAFLGSTRRALALLSQGSIDVNQGCEDGTTPLILASWNGSAGVVRALLDAGADVSIAKDDDFTALLTAAQNGRLAAAKLLMDAGADLEAANCQGSTSLHMAAEEGHAEVISALVEAGAKTGSRRWDGATPLYLAARKGRTETVRVLLRARADPLLAFTNQESGDTYLPLDTAAMFGHTNVIRELLKQAGIGGCGGATRGHTAFLMASFNQRMEIMDMLIDTGVVGTGEALINATEHGHEGVAKYLLKKFGRMVTSGRAYVDARDAEGRTPLLVSVAACRPPSPRMVRLFIDAGADTSAAVRVDTKSAVAFVTPVAYATSLLLAVKREGKVITEQERNTLEAVRSLLLREEAVHAISWVWPRVAPTADAAEGRGNTEMPSTSLGMMLPILRGRNESRRRTLLRTMFRWVGAADVHTTQVCTCGNHCRALCGFCDDQ